MSIYTRRTRASIRGGFPMKTGQRDTYILNGGDKWPPRDCKRVHLSCVSYAAAHKSYGRTRVKRTHLV
ncbi:hypothetical protein Y032_0003g1513 [Ancylostoma ceylanicum]|uniref:Uncharacterized protein n=1 Tax=Ancylostoma ceylanicum TaxID=53326 RepID=A0A016VY24_9BILA|nr:hypothetical protein Y032_0003g1513 [Ancylostoma ceylanicum]